MANYNRPNEKMRTVGLEGLGAFLAGNIPKNAGLDREEIVRLFNRNMAHRGQVANRPEDHQAALDAGKSPVQGQFPRGILNFGTGTPPDTSLPENFGTARNPDSFDRDDLERNDRMHEQSMRGGDDTLSYTETGDIVIPRHAAEANPGLAMAAMNVLAGMGANPNQYVVGSDEGSYNPDTGAQEFAWYSDIMKYGAKAADYVTKNDWAKAATSGALTYGGSKLMGADSKTAKYQALGAGLGTYAGLKFDDNLADKFEGYSTEATGEIVDGEASYNPRDLLEASKKAFSSYGGTALRGGGIGLSLGSMMAPAPPAFDPQLNVGDPKAMMMAAIKPMAEYRKDFAQNEQPNLSDTLSKPAPVAPIMPMPAMLPEGVSYQNRVRDRNTGEYRYSAANNPADQSAFARSIKGSNRRKGYGNMIFA